MNLLQMMPMPIIIDSGNSTPMTNEKANIMLGVFIFLNILYAVSWLITLVRYVIYLRKVKNRRGSFEGRSDRWAGMFDICMITIWGLVILVFVGVFIAEHFL